MNPGGASPSLSRRQLAAVAIGHGFEFYDFSVYSFFAVPIGRTFFPAADPWTSLLLSLAGMGAGFGARPLGALFFGAYADRVGQKPAMLLTILLMGLGTLAVATMPSYAALGIASPALMVAARLVQGFALGGEIGPSTTYLLDRAPQGRGGRAVSWQYALNGAAVLAIGLVGGLLSLALRPAALDVWGWRIALLLGLGVVPAGLAIRASLPAATAARVRSGPPRLWAVLARPRAFIAAVLIIGSGTVAFSICAFLTSYALTALGLSSGLAFLSSAVVGGATLATAPLAGWLADRHGGRMALLVSRVGMAVAAVPAFAWLAADHSSAFALLGVSAGLAALSTLGAPAGLRLIVDAMPAGSRATGLALVYTLGIGVFGASTQVALAALIAWTGDALAPAYYLIAACMIGAAAVFGLPDDAAP